MTQFLKKLRAWLAKLAFWRKRVADAAPQPEAEPAPAAAVDAAEPAPEQAAAKPGWLTRLKGLFTFRRKAEAVADTAEEAEAESVAEKKPRSKASEEAEVPEPKPGFFARLRQWLTFRRKPVETEAEPDAEVVAERKPRAKATEEPEVPEPKPGFFARLKGWLTFRRKPAETEAEADAEAAAEKKPKSKDSEEAEVPEPKPGFLARLKRWLSFRRKPAETEADDKTPVIDKAKTGSETTAADEEEAPPSRLKRFLTRLRSKRVWIPALSLSIVGLVSWVALVMMHATHEKERLQAELKAVKKMLEKKTVAAVVPPAPPPLSVPTEPVPAKPEKKIDPAFEIVGHIPAPQPEEESGINASDCVVKDKKSVSENLKSCISSFNQAVASAPKKPKKP